VLDDLGPDRRVSGDVVGTGQPLPDADDVGQFLSRGMSAGTQRRMIQVIRCPPIVHLRWQPVQPSRSPDGSWTIRTVPPQRQRSASTVRRTALLRIAGRGGRSAIRVSWRTCMAPTPTQITSTMKPADNTKPTCASSGEISIGGTARRARLASARRAPFESSAAWPIGGRPIGARPIGARPIGARPIGARRIGARLTGVDRGGRDLAGDYARVVGEQPGLGAIRAVQLDQYSRHVALDGGFRQVQPRANLGVGQALAEAGQHLGLPLGE